MCSNGDETMVDSVGTEASEPNVAGVSRTDESTQGALDALAALAAASTAVSTSHHNPPLSSSHGFPYRDPQEITPHHTSSDDDSEIMPPPPPRSPAAAPCLDAAGVTHPFASAPTPTASPSFTFLHESAPRAIAAGGEGGRLRSASNPEGMEKWDSYSRRNDRQHFVLPISILEEELASTRRVLGEVVDEDDVYDSNSSGATAGDIENIAQGLPQPTATDYQREQSISETTTKAANAGFQQHWVRRSRRTATRLGTSPDSVLLDLAGRGHPPANTAPVQSQNSSASSSNNINGWKKECQKMPHSPEIISSHSPPPEKKNEDTDKSALDPEELLRRARSRLLEDLSEGSSGGNGSAGSTGEKGGSVLILPHSLTKYKEVYNKNGRIGIYTPAERAAIIQKFNAKRARRVWNKKIRYNCRKNLADRRMRVKGRFVKRSVEASAGASPLSGMEKREAGTEQVEDDRARLTLTRSGSPPTTGSPLTTVKESEEEQIPDEEMLDVEDEDACFRPSEDMPYRRPRRYTIT